MGPLASAFFGCPPGRGVPAHQGRRETRSSRGWYLDFHHGAPGEGRRLKNLGSERRVPLHRQVVAEGFCKWVQGRPDGTLWPDLEPDTFGSRGGTASKTIGRWVRSLGITDPRKVLHSARHRFKGRVSRYGGDPEGPARRVDRPLRWGCWVCRLPRLSTGDLEACSGSDRGPRAVVRAFDQGGTKPSRPVPLRSRPAS